MKIDRISIEIMKYLKDGRKSLKKISEQLSVAENTVRARVNKMIKDGIMEISGLVDPEKIPGHMIIIVGVKLKTMNGVKKAEEFSKLKGVIWVSAVTGHYDLILLVALNEVFGLSEFITEELDSIKNVQSAETFVVYRSFNLKIPYIL